MADRANRSTALVLSVLLHAAVIGASLIAWPWSKELKPVEVMPVTLLTSDQLARLSAAEQSEVPAPAQDPEPIEDAPPEPAAETPSPEPQPAVAPKPAAQRPTPPAPAPTPKPTPAPSPSPVKTPAKPAPAKPAPAKPQPRVNLDELAASLAQTPRRGTGAPRSSSDQGLRQLERDLTSRKADGTAKAATANALGLVQAKLIRLWNPTCDVAGADAVQVRVRLSLTKSGGQAAAPELVDHSGSLDSIKDPLIKAAASRALSAAARGAPFDGLPVEDYDSWKTFIVRFDGKQACRGR